MFGEGIRWLALWLSNRKKIIAPENLRNYQKKLKKIFPEAYDKDEH